jgi:hypothetical protein
VIGTGKLIRRVVLLESGYYEPPQAGCDVD